MRIPIRHLLDYDSVALVVLLISMSIVTVLVVGLWRRGGVRTAPPANTISIAPMQSQIAGRALPRSFADPEHVDRLRCWAAHGPTPIGRVAAPARRLGFPCYTKASAAGRPQPKRLYELRGSA